MQITLKIPLPNLNSRSLRALLLGLIGSLVFCGAVYLMTPSEEEFFMEALAYSYATEVFSEQHLDGLEEARGYLEANGFFNADGDGAEHSKRKILGGARVKVDGLEGIRIDMAQTGAMGHVSYYLFSGRESLKFSKLSKNIAEIKDYFVIIWQKENLPFIVGIVLPKQGKKSLASG